MYLAFSTTILGTSFGEILEVMILPTSRRLFCPFSVAATSIKTHQKMTLFFGRIWFPASLPLHIPIPCLDNVQAQNVGSSSFFVVGRHVSGSTASCRKLTDRRRSATPTPTVNTPTRTKRQETCSGSLTKFTYFGVNESGAEFGQTVSHVTRSLSSKI